MRRAMTITALISISAAFILVWFVLPWQQWVLLSMIYPLKATVLVLAVLCCVVIALMVSAIVLLCRNGCMQNQPTDVIAEPSKTINPGVWILLMSTAGAGIMVLSLQVASQYWLQSVDWSMLLGQMVAGPGSLFIVCVIAAGLLSGAAIGSGYCANTCQREACKGSWSPPISPVRSGSCGLESVGARSRDYHQPDGSETALNVSRAEGDDTPPRRLSKIPEISPTNNRWTPRGTARDAYVPFVAEEGVGDFALSDVVENNEHSGVSSSGTGFCRVL